MTERGEEAKAALEIVRMFRADLWLAHRRIFPHRHMLDGQPCEAAEFHPELVADFWSADRYSIRMAYRGSAKSTLGEEDIALAACYRTFHNVLIIGSSEARAAERLAAVSYELVNNELIVRLFGDQKGTVWTQTKLVTANNVCIQAMGRDQDIRGIKFLDYRPDFVFVDDFEDKDTVQTPEGRLKTLRWFLAELLPACAPNRKVRIRATPMDAESVPMRLQRESRWPTRTYPIEYLDPDGQRRSSWPAAHPLEWIDAEKRTYERLGELAVWDREMMCRAVADSDVLFRKEMVRVVPRERRWEACYAFIDPARSIGQASATTGWAVWSWLQNRLVVWAADGQMLLPDEIVALAFDICERFDPVWLGVEEDSLNQWLLQPLRQEQVRRGVAIPYRGVAAASGTKGLGKLRFIRGLQPFFANREVEFAQPLDMLSEQLMNFPRGRIDAPNALAYALTMRPGLPIHENFSAEHIVEQPAVDRGRGLYLAAGATASETAAALLQWGDGRLSVLADWVRDGIAAETVPRIAAEAALAAEAIATRLLPSAGGGKAGWEAMLRQAAPDRYVSRRRPAAWVVPPHHADRYRNVGLMQAAKALPAETRLGGTAAAGQAALSDLLARRVRGVPAVEIGSAARWTLRALAGGYTRAMVRGRVQDYAEEGPYRLLLEAIESFAALVGRGLAAEDDGNAAEPNWAYDRQGRRYLSAMPSRGR